MSGDAPRAKILIVDDTAQNLDVLMATLSDRYAVVAARDGERALRMAARQPTPDLILLDIMMPGMDGFEVCSRLKEDENTRDIPVIFVTAMGEAADEVKGLALGAVDYVTKPITPEVVRARVATQLALRTAHRELEVKNQVLHEERELVEGIVTRMRDATHLDETGLRHLISSLERTNGDILLAAPLPDGGRHVMLGDFTGHGLPAAIGGPMVGYIFETLTTAGRPMEEILRELNRVLCRQLPTNLYMAACAFEIDATGRRARVWNLGVPEALLLRDGAVAGRFPSGGLPLGVIESIDPTEGGVTQPLEPGDRLYAYSDGITETTAPGGEMYGGERLEAYLSELRPEDRLESLLALLTQFSEGAEQSDDITLVEVTV